MVRNYKRKTSHGSYGQERLNEALDAIKSGTLSIRQASGDFSIPRKTLQRHLKGCVLKPGYLGRFRTVFDDKFQDELVSHILQMQQMFYGLTSKDVCKLAFDLAEKEGLDHPFNKEKGLAGRDWLGKFMKTHDITLRKPEATSIARAVGFNKPSVDKFYGLLKSELQNFPYQAKNIWNVDESGLTTVHRPQKVLAKKGQKQVGKVTSGERGKNVTIVCSMNATGVYIPPMIIFPRKRLAPALTRGLPPGSVARVSDNGWITKELFLEWLKHFVDSTKCSKEQKCILILDGHFSHKCLQVVTFAKDHGITMIILPPHCTHKMQPLDKTFFGPLKTNYNVEADKWMLVHPGCRISFYELSQLFGTAYTETATMRKAVRGFESTGLWPFNPEIFDEADFAPAGVTDEPQPPEASAVNTKDSTTRPEIAHIESEFELSTEMASLVTPIQPTPNGEETIEVEAVESAASTEAIQSTSANETTERQRGNIGLSSPVQGIIRSLSPIPIREQKRNRKRKTETSMVVTSSPYKQMLLEKQGDSVAASNQSMKSSGRNKKPKTSKQGTRKHAKKKHIMFPKSDDCRCLFCDELYVEPPSEEWMQCISCKRWYHTMCGDDESDLCDVCR